MAKGIFGNVNRYFLLTHYNKIYFIGSKPFIWGENSNMPKTFAQYCVYIYIAYIKSSIITCIIDQNIQPLLLL